MVKGRREVTLPQATQISLKKLLGEAMALVHVDGVPVGTAFFISDCLLLSCQHVATLGDRCAILTGQGELCEATVTFENLDNDFSLLSVAPSATGPRKCVLLGVASTDGACLVGGYPRLDLYADGQEIFPTTVHLRTAADNNNVVQTLIFEAGKIIASGMSGGPVLDLETGEVTGIVRWSLDPQDSLGGGAVPLSRIVSLSEDLQRLVKSPSLAVLDWRKSLGRELWESGGRTWEMSAQVDLHIGGDRKTWKISLDPAQGTEEVTVLDLGADVSEALFKWAQRRRVRWQPEVALLSQLLARALLPSGVATHLQALTGSDSVLIRMFFDNGNDLADIPWELAVVPGQPQKLLGADAAYRLVRVLPGRHPDATPPPGPDGVKVLAAVTLPTGWNFPRIRGKIRRDPYEWQDAPEMSKWLRRDVEARGFKIDVYESTPWNEVREALQIDMPDVFHFIGVGRLEADQPFLLFPNLSGHGEQPINARDVLAEAASNGVKLVVVELVLVPEEENVEPLTSSSLGDVFSDGLGAVVLTHLPVHPLQLQIFNQAFYKELGAGKAVEVAAQEARRSLHSNTQVEDAAGFGWFTLITDERPGLVVTASQQDEITQPKGPLRAKRDEVIGAIGKQNLVDVRSPDEFSGQGSAARLSGPRTRVRDDQGS
jgi:Trypsin-like peptidase domain/CHAT domain